jgi:NTP pyrophosphatase (non-canonical NTP hydrolase)
VHCFNAHTRGTKITKTSDKFRDEIDHFAQAMEYKLKRNDHKGGWEGADVSGLLDKLTEEVEELKEAIKNGNRYEITMEAADIANYSLMIAWNTTGRFGRDE